MNAGVVVAILSVIVAVLVPTFGGIIGHLLGRVNKLQDAREGDQREFDKLFQEQRREYEGRLLSERRDHETREALLEKALDTKHETVEELRRQNQRLAITADLQERFFGALPRSSSGPPAIRGDG